MSIGIYIYIYHIEIYIYCLSRYIVFISICIYTCFYKTMFLSFCGLAKLRPLVTKFRPPELQGITLHLQRRIAHIYIFEYISSRRGRNTSSPY